MLAGMKQVLSGGLGAAVVSASTAPPLATGSAKEGAAETKDAAQPHRPQFVLGVFHDLAALREAIASLLAGDLNHSQLLLVTRTPNPSVSALVPSADVRICHLDLETRNEDLLRHAIAAEPAFAPLWESMRGNPARFENTYPRIYTQLIHHLATGADVLIIRVHQEEQQRRTARAFLDCRCDILLTHEVSIR